MWDIEEIKRDRATYDRKLFESGRLFKDLEDLEVTAFKDGAIPRKYKELMGLAVSLNVKCYPCVQFHVDAAMAAGATREDVLETLACAVAMGGSVTQVVARFALKVLERWEDR